MAKSNSQFICQDCGSIHNKWSGKCSGCGSWNKLIEEVIQSVPKGMNISKGNRIELVCLEGEDEITERYLTGVSEFDRVCGGGIVPGSVILVGGDPGIGKSTVLLQTVASLSKKINCIYVSGEEAVAQVRLRAKRLGVEKTKVQLAAATNIRDILTTLEKDKPEILIIDSIQTMYLDQLDSAPGSVSQVRACAQELIRFGKKRNIAIVLVGHVTKEGTLAGPRVLEHMVDTVLYFEGDRGHQFRIMRAVKNRFGATDEIGVFEMTEKGLNEVPNPSELFLGQSNGNISGAAVFAGMEGSRPVLVELQALIAPSPLATPRRAVVGWEQSRLAMILAVLEARCGVNLVGRDVYLNVAGGLRVNEPAADLAVAASLLSAITDTAMPSDTVVFGEVGLSGEIRAVGQTESRLKEASKLGFTNALIPVQTKGISIDNLKIHQYKTLYDFVQLFQDLSKERVA